MKAHGIVEAETAFDPINTRQKTPVRGSIYLGRFPGLRVDAAFQTAMGRSIPMVHLASPLSAYSCGGSFGMSGVQTAVTEFPLSLPTRPTPKDRDRCNVG